METPRRDSNDFDMPSLASPMPSLLSPIPPSPMPCKSKSPRYTSLSSITRPDRNVSRTLLDNKKVSPVSSPLKLTLSRRTSENGRRDEWNIDKFDTSDCITNAADDSFNHSRSSKESKDQLKDLKCNSPKTRSDSYSPCSSSHNSFSDAKSYSKKSKNTTLSNAKTIDKIVLNLKKTAGAGDWTSTSSVTNAIQTNVNRESKSRISCDNTVFNECKEQDNSKIPPKQKRIGRKSIVTPKKLALKVKPIVINPKINQEEETSSEQTNKDQKSNIKPSNFIPCTIKISPDPKNRQNQKLIVMKNNQPEGKNSISKNIINKNDSSSATVKIPHTFKKPFILKKIDPAQLCNKQLVKIDPSQIPAIFKKRKVTDLNQKEAQLKLYIQLHIALINDYLG